jgi:hypothetical protein
MRLSCLVVAVYACCIGQQQDWTGCCMADAVLPCEAGLMQCRQRLLIAVNCITRWQVSCSSVCAHTSQHLASTVQ